MSPLYTLELGKYTAFVYITLDTLAAMRLRDDEPEEKLMVMKRALAARGCLRVAKLPSAVAES